MREWVLANPWIQSGSSRDPVGIQSGSSRGPVGIQSRTNVGRQIHRKQHSCRVLVILATSRQVQTWCQKLDKWCPTGSRLDPDWIPTGSRLDPDWSKVVPKNAQLVPDYVPTGSRLVFFKKTHISHNLSTYF